MPLDGFQHEVLNRPWICDSFIDHFHNYSPDTSYYQDIFFWDKQVSCPKLPALDEPEVNILESHR